MDVLSWILVAIRWAHALAAVAWVGGSIFYIMVLRPSRRRMQPDASEYGAAIGAEFRSLVNTAIGVLLLTGVILSLSRLTADTVTAPYVGVLVAKIILALYMFYVVRFLRPHIYT
ncbi:MAG: urate hydroxylase PuuD, partial [Chloroflexi bacterium]|nr:urate hydroxylase PuuD [Chloroflexota bacterium]